MHPMQWCKISRNSNKLQAKYFSCHVLFLKTLTDESGTTLPYCVELNNFTHSTTTVDLYFVDVICYYCEYFEESLTKF